MLSRRIFINSARKLPGNRSYSSTINNNLQQIKDTIIEKSNSINLKIDSLNEYIKKMHLNVITLKDEKLDDAKALEISNALVQLKTQNEHLFADINSQLISARKANREPRVAKNAAHAAFLEYFEKITRGYYGKSEEAEECLWLAVHHNDIDMVNYLLSRKEITLYRDVFHMSVACGYEDVIRSIFAAHNCNETMILYTRYGSMLRFIHQTTSKPNFDIISESEVKVVVQFKEQS